MISIVFYFEQHKPLMSIMLLLYTGQGVPRGRGDVACLPWLPTGNPKSSPRRR